MNTTELEKTANDLIFIISCGINGTSIDKARVQSMELAKVFKLASKHMLGSAVGMTLEMNGIKSELTAAAMVNAVRRDFFFEKAWSEISQKFEEEGIWYMPLKGAVIKSYYPKDAMREYSDYDILFDESRADDVRSIMEGLGFTTKSFGVSNDDVYNKLPVLNFELHRKLINSKHGDLFYDYSITINEKMKTDDSCIYRKYLSKEDSYIYFLVHEYKHFAGAGTGLRSLVDTYILNKEYNGNLDQPYLTKELKKLRLYEYERNNRNLANKLFTGKDLNNSEKELFERYLYSDAYGNFKMRIKNQGVDGSIRSKIKYAIKRLTLSERLLREKYPFFYKHKMFRPFLYIFRLIKKAKNNPVTLKSEIRDLKNYK